jgi:hypothetical protein
MQSWKVVTETVIERKQQLPTTTKEDLIMKKHDAIKRAPDGRLVVVMRER